MKKHLAATKMVQRYYRKRFKRLGKAAIGLQRLWCGYWIRELNQIPIIRNKCATLIQSLARVIIAKKKFCQRWRRNNCVITLQALYRGYLVRKTRYAIIRNLHTKWARAITLLAAHVRRRATHDKFLTLVAERNDMEFERQQVRKKKRKSLSLWFY